MILSFWFMEPVTFYGKRKKACPLNAIIQNLLGTSVLSLFDTIQYDQLIYFLIIIV